MFIDLLIKLMFKVILCKVAYLVWYFKKYISNKHVSKNINLHLEAFKYSYECE